MIIANRGGPVDMAHAGAAEPARPARKILLDVKLFTAKYE